MDRLRKQACVCGEQAWRNESRSTMSVVLLSATDTAYCCHGGNRQSRLNRLHMRGPARGCFKLSILQV